MMDKLCPSGAGIADRSLSSFEAIAGELSNAIALANDIADRLDVRNDRLFGTNPALACDPEPIPTPAGAVQNAMLLLSDLNFAIGRLNAQVERQVGLV